MKTITIEDIIRQLNLKPHPEGGYYSETYRCKETLEPGQLPVRYPSKRSFNTAIYFLLTADSCSRMHRLQTDEIFHFYLGDPVTMLQLYPDGSSKTVMLGSNIISGESPQVIVPKNIWQGSFIAEGGKFALLGTTVSPGFDFEDFEYGGREKLIAEYPAQKDLIVRLTK
jgi:predicted cupin superfamily sugar epimerase